MLPEPVVGGNQLPERSVSTSGELTVGPGTVLGVPGRVSTAVDEVPDVVLDAALSLSSGPCDALPAPAAAAPVAVSRANIRETSSKNASLPAADGLFGVSLTTSL
jgi:hypothetical protein